MPLPTLNWKKLPRFDLQRYGSGSNVLGLLNAINSLFSTGSYYDGSPRVIGTNSAWNFRTEVSGTTTVAVYGRPPTMTEMSQSVIFAGSFAYTGSKYPKLGADFVFPGSVAAQAEMTNSLLIGTAINAGNYINWTSQSVFNSGSNMPLNSSSSFSGYHSMTRNITEINRTGSLKYLYAWESQEAIAIQLSFTSSASGVTNSGISLALAGAITDPESNDLYDAHSDGRLYGLITSGVGTASGNFYNSGNGYFGNLFPTAGGNQVLYAWSTPGRFFKPNGFSYISSSYPPYIEGFPTITFPTMSSITSTILDFNTTVGSELSSSSNQTPVFPIYMKWGLGFNTSIDPVYQTRYYQGSLREIKMIRNLPSGLTYRSASIDIGHIFGSKDSGSAVLGNSMILMA
jgi:hypothetical protein